MKIQFKSTYGLASKLLCFAAVGLITACSAAPVTPEVNNQELSAIQLDIYQKKLSRVLESPEERVKLIAKVLGSTVEDERHAFLKFHIYGYAGDGNLIPFFTLNNYVVQKWKPEEDSSFSVQHYEVGYYSKFDTNEPLEKWENPLTGEVIDIPHFVLGPVPRFYEPNMSESAASFASDPINITMIGDRVYIPTLSKLKFPNPMTVEEWGPYSSGPISYWDSMTVFSADVEDVFDEDKTYVPAEIHMQNLVSFAPFVKLGETPGRTMARAYGQHIAGYDALPVDIRANLEKYTPEIFDIEEWTELRMDSIDLANDLKEQRANGTLDIDQPDYVPYEVRLPF